MFHSPNLTSIFWCLGHDRESIQVWSSTGHFITSWFSLQYGVVSPCRTPKLQGHPCRMSATAYSIYLQLSSIPRGHLLHPPSEDVPCHGTTLTDQNCMHKEIKSRINSGNACYHLVQSLLSSCLLSRNVKGNIYKTIIPPVVLLSGETRSLTLREQHRLWVFENMNAQKNILT
jgi:hypothetical protein